jgi:hypothetical protein
VAPAAAVVGNLLLELFQAVLDLRDSMVEMETGAVIFTHLAAVVAQAWSVLMVAVQLQVMAATVLPTQ